MKKAYLNVMFRISILMKDELEISDVMRELDYDFHTTDFDKEEGKLSYIIDTEMVDYEVIDTKVIDGK